MSNDKKKEKHSLQDQLRNTRSRMDEAQDRLEASNLPEEEQRKIREKNKHRQEMIAGLESELDDGYNVGEEGELGKGTFDKETVGDGLFDEEVFDDETLNNEVDDLLGEDLLENDSFEDDLLQDDLLDDHFNRKGFRVDE